MFETMRWLHSRGADSLGISVDAEGAMLGPDCVLVRRTAQGYRCIAPSEAAALQDFLFGDAKEPDWLFGHCRRIAEALDEGELALAQILGLHIPIDDLTDDQLRRLAGAGRLIKANFNPDEPRVPKGNPDGGQWTNEDGGGGGGGDGGGGEDGGDGSDAGDAAASGNTGDFGGDAGGGVNSGDDEPAGGSDYSHDSTSEDGAGRRDEGDSGRDR